MTKNPEPETDVPVNLEAGQSSGTEIRYDTYLQLDKLLDAQRPISDAPEHDVLDAGA